MTEPPDFYSLFDGPADGNPDPKIICRACEMPMMLADPSGMHPTCEQAAS